VGVNKVSICLLNTRSGFTTPWHCSVAELADGEWISAPMGEFIKDDRLELIYSDGLPTYFREKPKEGDPLGIADTQASYLQGATPLNAAGYLSGASTPLRSSSRTSFVDTPPATVGGSTSSTPKTQSPPIHASARDDEVVEDALDNAPLSGAKDGPASIPYGKRLIPQIIDNLAATDPERMLFSLTSMNRGHPEFQQVTARDFARAVDKTAWWLLNQIGQPESILPVGYIGPRKWCKETIR
jgi:hypothetical protein